MLMTGHSRASAAQVPHRAADKVLILHHIPTLLCLGNLSCCLPSEAKMDFIPNSPPIPRRKMRNFPMDVHGSQPGMAYGQKGPFSKEDPWSRQAFYSW